MRLREIPSRAVQAVGEVILGGAGQAVGISLDATGAEAAAGASLQKRVREIE